MRAVGVARGVRPASAFGGFRRSRVCCRCRRALRRFVEDPEDLAHLHVVAILAIDAAQHTGVRRADLDVDLVGLELDEWIAGGNGVAFLAQPLRHSGIDDGFTDFWDDDI